MVCETGALQKVLLLARRILRADLLAIDALHREALVVFCKRVSFGDVGARNERVDERELPFARNSTNAAWTS